MYSRAHLLIEKEMREVNNEPDMSISKLNENSIFELVAYIQGLSHSPWEKGVFKLNLKFTERYNQEPPKVTFQTIPYHPNIDEKTGRPSLDFLDEYSKWRPNIHTIRFILKNLQYLLANPYLDRAINMGAVFLLKDNPLEFESIIKESVIASQKLFQQKNNPSQLSYNSNQSIRFRKQIQTGTTSHKLYDVNEDNDDEYFAREYAKFQEKTKSFKNISFEDYIDLWRGIATTKANTYEENIYLKSKVFENPAILFQHLSISLKDLEREVYKQLTEHKNLMYGNFDFSNRKFSNEKVFGNSDRDGSTVDNIAVDPIDEVKRSIVNNSNISNQLNVNNNDSNDNTTNENSKNNFNDTMNESSLNLKTRITPSPKVIKVTASIKKASSSKLTDQQSFIPNEEELFEKEVDDLINWTKNI